MLAGGSAKADDLTVDRLLSGDQMVERRFTRLKRLAVLVDEIPVRIVVGELVDLLAGTSVNLLDALVDERQHAVCVDDRDPGTGPVSTIPSTRLRSVQKLLLVDSL